MIVTEEAIRCFKCDKLLGMMTVTSNGTRHQFFSATCLECLPGVIEDAKKRGVPEENIRDALEVLHSPLFLGEHDA